MYILERLVGELLVDVIVPHAMGALEFKANG